LVLNQKATSSPRSLRPYPIKVVGDQAEPQPDFVAPEPVATQTRHFHRHIKSDGKKCHSPAQRGSAYCYFHARSRRREQRMQQFRKLHEGIQEIPQPQ
jgi:hypothetical protein